MNDKTNIRSKELNAVYLKSRRFKYNRDIPLYLLILPAFLLILVFNYFPMYGVIIAFKDYSPWLGIIKSDWIGFEHFKFFLNDRYFWQVMVNTLRINIFALIFGFPAPIILALLLNEVAVLKFKKFVQTVSYLPYFISWVITAALVYAVLDPNSGILNVFMDKVLGIAPVYFMAQSRYFVAIVIIAGIWKGIGMSSIYYLASLSSIDTELYEAAKIDGAGRIKQTWHITLPGLKTIATVLLVLNLGSMVTIGFENIFLLYNPLVYDVGDVISTYTYRLGLVQMEYSLTSAIGLTQSFVNFFLVVSANYVAKKIGGWGLW